MVVFLNFLMYRHYNFAKCAVVFSFAHRFAVTYNDSGTFVQMIVKVTPPKAYRFNKRVAYATHLGTTIFLLYINVLAKDILRLLMFSVGTTVYVCTSRNLDDRRHIADFFFDYVGKVQCLEELEIPENPI